jgi:hypothetical protein
MEGSVDLLVIVLRLIHVVAGALWVGMATFTTYYLQPALQEAGPDGGKVMAAIQRRGIMTVMPILAVATLLSGLWLYLRAAGGQHAAFAQSGPGMAFGIGGLAAIAGWLTGMFAMRPAMMKAVALAQSLGPAATPEERQRVGPQAEQLRRRATVAGKAMTHLLFLAIAAMAVARYIV